MSRCTGIFKFMWTMAFFLSFYGKYLPANELPRGKACEEKTRECKVFYSDFCLYISPSLKCLYRSTCIINEKTCLNKDLKLIHCDMNMSNGSVLLFFVI